MGKGLDLYGNSAVSSPDRASERVKAELRFAILDFRFRIKSKIRNPKSEILCDYGCPQTGEGLHSLGFTVFEAPLGEFIKAGGSAKCLVLKVPHAQG